MIRKYKPRDAEQLLSILVGAKGGIANAFFANKKCLTTVVEEDGKILGFSTIEPCKRRAYLIHFGLQQKGVTAEILMQLLEGTIVAARSLGCSGLVVPIPEESNGFERLFRGRFKQFEEFCKKDGCRYFLAGVVDEGHEPGSA